MKKETTTLLINLPGKSIRTPEEHCGLAFLKAFGEQQGYHIDILDAYAEGISMDQCKARVAKWLNCHYNSIRFVGISPFVTSHSEFVELGEFIRNMDSDCCIYAGGHYASLNKEYLIDNLSWLDAIIVGEGEITMIDLLEKGINDFIPGLFTRANRNSFVQRERIQNLDVLPFQARYLTLEQLRGQPMTITTSRGCYGECSFCSISSFYKLNSCTIKQTFRSATSVSDEIHCLFDKYKINSLKIVDDNFFRGNSDDFLEKLTEKICDLNISFRLSARPNDITPNRARYLKKMGASIIGIGVESADEKSLQLFNKGIDISDSERAIEILNNEKITCLINYIMFNPILDMDGLMKNCLFVEKHSDVSVFHRINSHLWLRTTDPMVQRLRSLGLCTGEGFPYVEYTYCHEEVETVKCLFDLWCNHNMKEYYRYADILMAQGIAGNEDIDANYRKLLREDIIVLKTLIDMAKNNDLNSQGTKYIENCLLNGVIQ